MNDIMGDYRALLEEMLTKKLALMTDFPILSYTSTCEIPTHLYT